MSNQPILVAIAWPYASGSRHIGHLAGAYLPGDIFASYQRLVGNRVLMVSGSDFHGTPITVRADDEGVTPEELATRYHDEFVSQWDALGFSWDLYTKTSTANHHSVTQDVFTKLLENGYIERRTSEQLYDPEAGRFLPDRYVEGTCPHCGYTDARGDQCENCGRTLDPVELIDPRSRFTGSTPELRSTDHFFFLLSKFEQPLSDWLKSREGWRKHVVNFAVGAIEEGLPDRAITRDLDWGVDIPVDDLGPGKKIYVWFDAVIGYLSASKEWSTIQGDEELWRTWWQNEDAEHYYFIGKDNVTFHSIFWPAMLMGYGGLNLPTDIPANQFVTFKGGKASSSRGVGMSISEALERFEPDALRYALAANFPEMSDSDISEEEMIRRVNDELVATWGNLVNRVWAMTGRYFEGIVPQPAELDADDQAVLDGVDATLLAAGTEIAEVRLKAALGTLMAGAQDVNTYLSTLEPWKTAKVDMERTGTTLYVALQGIAGLAVGLLPYLPFTSQQVLDAFGVAPSGYARPEVATGHQLPPVKPLFTKMELPAADGA